MAVAAAAARAAAHVLLALRVSAAGRRDLRDRADRAAQAAVAGVLARHRPDDPVLSEEAPDDSGRRTADRVWVVDPLDGTREYGEPGRADWAVHVALWQSGGALRGAVALPARGLLLTSDDPTGGVVPLPRTAGPPRVALSRSRAVALLRDVVDRLGGQRVPMGSAGAKTAAVVLGEADAYVHVGGQHQWDSAAPVAVARAAGLHASRVDGSPLRYNEAELSLPDLVVCRPELATAVLAAFADARAAGAG